MEPDQANSGVMVASGQKPRRKHLHVLTLTPFYPSAGDEVSGCFVAELLQQLSSEDITSTVMAVNALHHGRKVADIRNPAEWLRYPQFPGNLGLSSAGILLYARIRKKAHRLHRQRHIDVIHAHAALPCGHAGALLAKDLGIPFAVSVHGLDAFNTCFVQGASVAWRRKASWEVYRQARTVVCISEKVRHVLTDAMGSEVHTTVVYNGTDTECFSPGVTVARDDATLLIVGNLLRGKGQELILQAVAKLKDEHPFLRCLFVGDGPDRRIFLESAKQLGIEGQVSFVGRKGRAEVAAAMRRSTMFVLPSTYEGLGCVYLEAMASEMPVIACRGQGIDEIIRHQENGWLIGVGKLDELVQGISLMLQNPGTRTEMGKAARATILNGLTLSDQAKCMRSVYDSVIA